MNVKKKMNCKIFRYNIYKNKKEFFRFFKNTIYLKRYNILNS